MGTKELYNEAVKQLRVMFAEYKACRETYRDMAPEYRGGIIEQIRYDEKHDAEVALNAQMSLVCKIFKVDAIQLRNAVLD